MTMRWMKTMTAVALAAGMWSAAVVAQNAAAKPAIVTTPELFNMEKLAEQGRAMLAKAAAGNGSAGMPLSNYAGHYMTLNARTKSGGGEFHKNWNDFLVVLDGEGTELTGGTIVDPKPGADGEIRGSRLEGATAHVLHKGDFIHIPAGTPHQQLVGPGKTLVVLAIKVEASSAAEGDALKMLTAPPPPPPPPAPKRK